VLSIKNLFIYFGFPDILSFVMQVIDLQIKIDIKKAIRNAKVVVLRPSTLVIDFEPGNGSRQYK
jgi:hypothetical protein